MKWEYEFTDFDIGKWNELGREGWELVAVTEFVDEDHFSIKCYGYFKRPVSQSDSKEQK